MFKSFVFLMGSGRLFHKEGPMSNKVSCSVLVLQKVCLNLAKLLCIYSTVPSEFKDFIQIKMTVAIDKLERYCIYALMNSFFSRQPINLNYIRDIYCILSNLRQNRIYLFYIIFIFFFAFPVRIEYHAGYV